MDFISCISFFSIFMSSECLEISTSLCSASFFLAMYSSYSVLLVFIMAPVEVSLTKPLCPSTFKYCILSAGNHSEVFNDRCSRSISRLHNNFNSDSVERCHAGHSIIYIRECIISVVYFNKSITIRLC